MIYQNINIIVSSLIIKSNVLINLFSSKFKNTFSIFSASLIDEFVPGQMITGTGADIIFKIPVMRQIMAWIGTMPAKRKNITKIFEKGSKSVEKLICFLSISSKTNDRTFVLKTNCLFLLKDF